MNKSPVLRNLVIELQQSDKWNVNAVRNLTKWKKVLELTTEIRKYAKGLLFFIKSINIKI